jgi:hypothetical protein
MYPKMDAGPGFEPGMLRAYETGVVAALPAIKMVGIQGFEPCSPKLVSIVGFEPTTLCSQSRCANQTALHRDNGCKGRI